MTYNQKHWMDEAQEFATSAKVFICIASPNDWADNMWRVSLRNRGHYRQDKYHGTADAETPEAAWKLAREEYITGKVSR